MRTNCPVAPSSPKPRLPLRTQRVKAVNFSNNVGEINDYYDDEQLYDENDFSNQTEETPHPSDESDNETETYIQNNSTNIAKKFGTINNKSTPSYNNYTNKIFTVLMLILSSIILYGLGNSTETISLLIPKSDDRKYCDVNALKQEFPQQKEHLWITIKSGIETTINRDPTKPSVFLFVYHDKRVVKKFTKQIIDMTQKCMETEHNAAVILNTNDMSTDDIQKDYGVAIQKYRQQMTKSGVLFVEDLNKIPGTAAQAFHVMCDTVSPLVSRLIVYMTMHIDPMYNDNKFQLLEYVEENLKSNWSDLQPNIFDPLLARVTDQILLLK